MCLGEEHSGPEEQRVPKMGTCVMCRRNSKEPNVAGVERMGDGEVEDPG